MPFYGNTKPLLLALQFRTFFRGRRLSLGEGPGNPGPFFLEALANLFPVFLDGVKDLNSLEIRDSSLLSHDLDGAPEVLQKLLKNTPSSAVHWCKLTPP
jgi:hypothetical protein